MARETAGFTWPPGAEDKAESDRGVQRVGVSGIISSPSLVRLTCLRGAEGTQPPRGLQGFTGRIMVTD